MNDTKRRDRLIGAAIAAGRLPLDKAPLWASQWAQAPGPTERALDEIVAKPSNATVSNEEMRELFPGRFA